MPARPLARTPRAGRLVLELASRLARGSGANGCSRTRPLRERPGPGDEPVDEERLGDVAVLRDHELRYSSGSTRVGGRGRAGRCPSAAGSGPGAGSSRRGSGARGRSRSVAPALRRRSGGALERSRAGSRTRERQSRPLREVGRGSPGRRRRGSAAPGARPRAPVGSVGSSQLRAGTNVAPAVCERQTLDDGAQTRPRAVLRARSRRATGGGSRARASVGRGARAAPGASGAARARTRRSALRPSRSPPPRRVRELPLQLRDATRPVQPRVREVVPRAHEVERRPHERRLHDAPAGDGTHEILGAEALDARPEPEVRRGRPLRLEPSRPLERLATESGRARAAAGARASLGSAREA